MFIETPCILDRGKLGTISGLATRDTTASTQIFYHTVNIFTSPHINIFCCVNNFACVQWCIYLSWLAAAVSMKAPAGGNMLVAGEAGSSARCRHPTPHTPSCILVYSAFCSSCPSIYTYTICIMYLLGLDPMGKSAACPWLCREAGAAPGPCSCMQLGTVTSGQAAAGKHHTRGVSLSPGCYYLSLRVLNVSTLLLKWK